MSNQKTTVTTKLQFDKASSLEVEALEMKNGEIWILISDSERNTHAINLKKAK